GERLFFGRPRLALAVLAGFLARVPFRPFGPPSRAFVSSNVPRAARAPAPAGLTARRPIRAPALAVAAFVGVASISLMSHVGRYRAGGDQPENQGKNRPGCRRVLAG